MTLRDHLTRIFDAERQKREAETLLLAEGEPGALSDLLASATREALALDDEAEAERRLVCLVDLCAQVPGAATTESLLAILDHESELVRTEAGEALLDVAYERFKEVALAIEGALEREHAGLGMQELPFILIEVHDPDPLPLIARFLQHPDANVVAAAIEALVERGDPAAAKHLRPLVGDRREASLDDLEGEGPVMIGDLARDALKELGA